MGGEVADDYRYPYAQVSLQDWKGHTCGGSVVAPDVILSAAHCASAFDKVIVGLYNLSDIAGNMTESFGVSTEYRHPQYNDFTTQYDVLLIKLDGNITVVDPVRINDDTTIPTMSDALGVMGWGATSFASNNVDYPELLHDVELSYIPNIRCRQMKDDTGLNLGPWLFEDMMCATDDGKDSCYGDSGGPLVKLGSTSSDEPDLQVGIVSWGLECGGPVPGIYHRLSYTYPWIQQTICRISDSPPDYFNCNTQAPTTSPAPSYAPSSATVPVATRANSTDGPVVVSSTTLASSLAVGIRLSSTFVLLALLPILL